MFSSFQGITALITGASAGIGEVFARELAKAGSHLILTARSEGRLQKLADELSKAHGIRTHVIAADLSQSEGPRKIFDEVCQAGLSVDLLINNAGFGFCGPFEKSGLTNDHSMVQVNIASLVDLTHLFLPGMLQRGAGGILNVASTASFQPLPKLSVYAATKAFVLSFSEALWAEYKDRGIRVFCLCPGNTESEFHDRAGIPSKFRFMGARTLDLVRFGLDQFLHTRKPSAIHGLRNRILAFGHRILPREWVVRITSLLYR